MLEENGIAAFGWLVLLLFLSMYTRIGVFVVAVEANFLFGF